MRQYQCERTGLVLGVIDGGGLGDGIPRGNLRLVTDKPLSLEVPKRWFEFKLTKNETVIRFGPFEYTAKVI